MKNLRKLGAVVASLVSALAAAGGTALAHSGHAHSDAVAPDLHPAFVFLELVLVLTAGYALSGFLARIGREETSE